MKVKRIAMLILAVAVVGSGTTAVYASKKSDVATKNVVVTAQKQQVSKRDNANAENKEITDEQAVQMAAKALKDYMGLDANYFSKSTVTRDKVDNIISDKIHRHGIINVDFTPANGTNGGDFVDIDGTTGKIVNVTATNNLVTYTQGKVDDAKVREAAINFMKKIGQDGDVDFSKITVDNNNGPLSVVKIALKDQSRSIKGTATIDLEVSLQDYTVMHYENDVQLYYK